MKRVFGAKKDKEPPPSIQDTTDRISKRGDSVDDKIKKLDSDFARYKEKIKKTRPGPAQEAVKARAMRVLKQRKMYEGQRDMLYNQTFNLDQVAFASEGIKDAQQTMSALKSANKELKGMMKNVKIQDIDNLQDEMMDLMDVSNEIQESLGVEAIMYLMTLMKTNSWVNSMLWKQTWGLKPRVMEFLLISNLIMIWMQNSTCHQHRAGMLLFLPADRVRMN